ncbi:hypothetical protein SpCBS45565_g07296 [Spizellomyces sp. 'palustris']|nr:hypothetical protein SpCBS45565_g07296 [Spizellomyces sp. 'palustris']
MSRRDYGGEVAQPQPAGNRWAAAAAQAADGNRSSTGYRSWETVDDEPEDFDNTDWLQRKTKKVQNDSLHSTRRALQRLNETDAIATSNLTKLNQQSEQLYKVNSRLESAEQHVKVSDSKADHLKSLNRYFFLPSFGGKKAREREDAAKRENAERSTRDESALSRDRQARDERFQSVRNANYMSSTRGMYSTPQGIERDDTEEEIDNNLDQISSGLMRLKMMSQSMNTELDSQKDMIGRISDRTDRTGEKIRTTTRKIERIK